jgi:transcriptional regulator with XRE-family HTH domain
MGKLETKKQIGLRLRELRKKRGLSQEQAAAQAGITTSHLSNIESGKENPTVDTFTGLASTLGVSLSDIFDIEHQVKKKELQKIINQTAEKSSEEELRLIVKFINTINK